MPKGKPGRPKGVKNKSLKSYRGPVIRGLRFEYYSDMPSSKGGSISGFADQYGRVMEQFVNEQNAIDIRPSGHCIAARH